MARGEKYDNIDKGALFKNDRKQRDSQPDYTGKIELSADLLAAAQSGAPIYISAWKKTIKNGDRAGELMLSLALSVPKKNEEGDSKKL